MEMSQDNQQINQVNQEAPLPETPSKQRFPLIIMLGLASLILIIIMGGMYLVGIKNKSQLNFQSNQAPIQQSISPTPWKNNVINSRSSSDLSYITLVVSPSVQIRVTNSAGVVVGEGSFSPPMSNEGETLGTGVTEFLLPEPLSDTYTVVLSSSTSGDFVLNIDLMDRNANDKLKKFTGTIKPNKSHVFNIIFDKEDVEKSVVVKVEP